VGTPKGRLSKLEKDLLDQPWQQARAGVTVKLLPQEGELYVLARSADRVAKERSMRRRQLKRLWHRLHELKARKLRREDLLMKLGAARQQSPSAWRLVAVEVHASEATFTYSLKKDKLRQVRRREGRYLLRSNVAETDPALVWTYYLQLVQVEQAFRNLKGDLALRPIFHQDAQRIEAHIFVSFLAYCLHVTLGQWLRTLAPGLTTRSVLEKFAAVQMVDVHIPTSDGRTLILSRYTQPERDLQLLLARLKLELPAQPPPRITAGPGAADVAL
jgi:transposase